MYERLGTPYCFARSTVSEPNQLTRGNTERLTSEPVIVKNVMTLEVVFNFIKIVTYKSNTITRNMNISLNQPRIKELNPTNP